MKPIIKWPGGKTQLLNRIREMMPNTYGTYFEPFFGGGALYFNIQPDKAVISDANMQLMTTYANVQQYPVDLMKVMDQLQSLYNALPTMQDKEIFFKRIRSKYNEAIQRKDCGCETSASMIFLNKSDFNGLYKTNRKGEFNVAFGQKKRVNLYDAKNIIDVSKQLNDSDTIIKYGDYTSAVTTAKPGDFVFFDPPYFNTFTKYQAKGFTAEDQRRLADLYKQLSSNGVYCMLTNSDTDYIKELYKDFSITSVAVRRNVNRDAAKRTGREVIITNY